MGTFNDSEVRKLNFEPSTITKILSFFVCLLVLCTQVNMMFVVLL
jgi:hypothetical protein